MHGREHARQQAVAGHGVEDAGLAVHQHQDDRGQADDGADLDDLGEPAPGRAERVDRDRDRIGHVQQFVVDHQGHHDGNQDVQHGADQQRTDDAERHVALRVLGFLAGGGHRFEADVGEEHDRCGAEDAAPAVFAFLAGRFRDERIPVGLQGIEVLDHVPADDDDEGDDDRGLDGDDDVVDLGAFRHADDQQAAEQQADQEGRQVEQGGDRIAVGAEHRHAVTHQRVAVGAGQFRRDDQAVVAEQADHVARPADRDHRGRQSVFEQQQAAHDPGREFADRGVAVGVGRAGHRQGRGQLGVAQAGQGADDARDQEGQQHGRTGVQRRGVAGADEDAGADDATDAQEHEVPGTERPLQGAGFAFPLDLLHAFPHQHARKESRVGIVGH